jgi:hypothetical protein
MQVQEWAKAPLEEEQMEMDMEKPSNGANPNVATRDEEEEEEGQAMLDTNQPAQRSANPFTAGQASNPFR